MALGLKGSWKETKGCYLWHRLKELRWNLKYAWQRAWRGWDSRDMFNIDTSFISREKEILKAYRKNHYTLLNVPEEYIHMFDNRLFFNEDETNMILDMLIFHLDMMDEDYVEKLLYGKNIYDDDYVFDKDFAIEKCKRISSIIEQNKNAFMKLFTIFFWDLWD